MLNADLVKLSALVSGLMNDLKEGTLPDSLAAALKGHIPSTYCILMLLEGNNNLTVWMICSQCALPPELHIGSFYEAGRMTSVRTVLDSGKPTVYQPGSGAIDADLSRILTAETLSALIVPLRINESNNGVMLFGMEPREASGTFLNEQIECAVTISRQVETVLTLCSWFGKTDGLRARFQTTFDSISGTAAPTTIGELIRSVEHEINNPLNVIVNWSEVYRDDATIDPDLRIKFQIIYDMSMRISDVIQKFAKLQDPKAMEFVRGNK